MRRPYGWIVPVFVGVTAAAGPIDPFIQPNRPPAPQKQIRPGQPFLELEATFDSDVVGDFFGDFVGNHTTVNRTRPAPAPPPGPPPPPPPLYNVPPQRIVPPAIPNNVPRPNIIVPWKKVVPSGPLTPRPPGQPRGYLPLPPEFRIEYASVIGETGIEHEFRVTEIFDLALLPSSATTSQGTWLIDWGALGDFDSTVGRFYLLEAEIPMGELFVPEPGSALMLMTLALTLRRFRSGR